MTSKINGSFNKIATGAFDEPNLKIFLSPLTKALAANSLMSINRTHEKIYFEKNSN